MTVLSVSILLAVCLGFAAHRASICTVKATAELLSRRRAVMLYSFFKTFLWVELVAFTVAWWSPGHSIGDLLPITTTSLFGGALFGVGAAINQGCSFSTISKLAEGQLRMLATVGGLVMGAVLFILAVDSGVLDRAAASKPASPLPRDYLPMILGALILWAYYQLHRLWRTHDRAVPLHRLPLSDSYRLSFAALILGLCNGVLWSLHGRWSYTTILRSSADATLDAGSGPAPLLFSLLGAVIVGAAFSAWQRGSFQLRFHLSLGWLSNICGGTLMGFGAAMTPGGNDVLLFHSMPSFSPHALPAYGAMLLGITLVLLIKRWTTGAHMKVSCDGDLCRETADR